jgi:histidyl-tRNA synthetase
MFRYDRPQAGRYRQFTQWDVEIFGDAGPWTDADLIAMGIGFFQEFGIPTTVHVNSIGDSECRPRYRQALVEYLQPIASDLSPESQRRLLLNPLRVLDDKGLPKSIAELAPRSVDYLCGPCAEHFDAVRDGLDTLGLPWAIDHRLVRGLDYYTRTTFEYFEVGRTGQQDALGGGGRYDGLIGLLGGKPTAGIGFGIGVERTASAIARSGTPSGSGDVPVIAIVGGEANGATRLAIAKYLREHEKVRNTAIQVRVDGSTQPLRKQLGSVARYATQVVIVGTDANRFVVRDLASGDERNVSLKELPSRLLD